MTVPFCATKRRVLHWGSAQPLSTRPRSTGRGFTLIETLVVIAISAILMMLATPPMRNIIERNRVSSSVNSLVGAISFARTEALKRGMPVSICRSIGADSTNTPTCTAGAEWNSGWIVYADLDHDDAFDASKGDVLLRTQGSLAQGGTITQNGLSNPSLDFAASGWMDSGMSSFVFCSPSQDADTRRTAAVGKSGRARLVADPTKACG